MLQAGKSVINSSDQMQKLTVEQLYKSLVNPKPEIKSAISQLRTVLTIDPKKYALLKRKLPYITCGIFNPPFRKTENFAAIEVFILDIDHLSQKGENVEDLKQKLKSDSRIELMFTSPGADGLKILFRLSEKCFDHAKYSMFYKVFARSFSEQYGLNQVIDTRTSDVARACFISIDNDAFYNPEPEKVNINAFVNFDDPFQIAEIKETLKKPEKDAKQELPQKELTDDVINQIKQKLNPSIRTVKEKNIFIPEEIDKVMPMIDEHVKKFDITISSVKGIHYGKQIRFSAGVHFAEINLFYGKRGYVVVATSKSGANKELAEITKNLLCDLLYPQEKKSNEKS
jgi:hypothetical protein